MTELTRPLFLEALCAQLATRTGVPRETITADSEFALLGLQSVDAVLLCTALGKDFALEIDPSDIFEHDTPGSFADAVIAQAAGPAICAQDESAEDGRTGDGQ